MGENIRDYYVSSYTVSTGVAASVSVRDTAQERYGKPPTVDEVEKALGEHIDYLSFYGLYKECRKLKATPRVADVQMVSTLGYAFEECTSLRVAPMLQPVRINGAFQNCTGLIQPAVAPRNPLDNKNYKSLYVLYDGCSSLAWPVSIPDHITDIDQMYNYCGNMAGEFIVRSNKISEYDDALRGTVKPITIYGDRSVCETIAATADNGNASWQPWYDPVPAVTDRGPNSYTTSEDMTRMVRNGALAVNTYAPGRMVYHKGDIVREDEWNALVEAAQTIDPTVTYSTVYSNLNKIEAAFDSAL